MMKEKVSKNMRKKILIIVDPQNDFIEGGSLEVPGGKQAMINLAEHLKDHARDYERIIVSLDSHTPGNLGFKENWIGPKVGDIIMGRLFPKDLIKEGLVFPKDSKEDVNPVLLQPDFMCWPAHCVIGTSGHKIFKPLQDILDQEKERVVYLTKGEDNARDCYSIFHYGDGGLTRHADPFVLWEGKVDLVISGLALDYCVFETVKSIQELGVGESYTIPLDVTAGIRGEDIVMELYDGLSEKVRFE